MSAVHSESRRPTTIERVQDALWTIGTSVASALLAALSLYAVGEVTGVNARIFDGTCDTIYSLSAPEKEALLRDPEARQKLDRDRDGVLCE
jgi:hypothetical protein